MFQITMLMTSATTKIFLLSLYTYVYNSILQTTAYIRDYILSYKRHLAINSAYKETLERIKLRICFSSKSASTKNRLAIACFALIK